MRDVMHKLGSWELTEEWIGLPMKVCSGRDATTWEVQNMAQSFTNW